MSNPVEEYEKNRPLHRQAMLETYKLEFDIHKTQATLVTGSLVAVIALSEVQVVAEPEAGGWQVSVSHRERFPTVEELRTTATLASGVGTMWFPLPVPGGDGQVPSTFIHLFETPPGHSPNSLE